MASGIVFRANIDLEIIQAHKPQTRNTPLECDSLYQLPLRKTIWPLGKHYLVYANYTGRIIILDQLANINIIVNIIHLPINKLEVSTLKTNTLGEVVGLTWMIGMTLEGQAIWQV